MRKRDPRGLSFSALATFVAVAEAGSFTRAAELRSTSKTQVSQAVRALERHLGTSLLLRTTRSVTLTPDGAQLLGRAREMLASADEVEALFARGGPVRGRVRVDLPVALARTVLLPALRELHERHPALELSISTTDRYVDVVREGFDCVLRVGVPPESSLMAVRLGAVAMTNCASPAYVAAHGVPRTPADLSTHWLVHYSPSLHADGATFEWQEEPGPGTAPRRPLVHEVAMRSRIAVNGTDAFRAAVVAGLGIAQLPRFGVTELLARGELVEILPDHRAPPLPVSIVHAHGRRVPRRVRAVMEWLSSTLAPLAT